MIRLSLTSVSLFFRLRFLTDMESKLVALRSEIQDLRDTCAETSTSDTGLSELQAEWENAHRAVTERWREMPVIIGKLFVKCCYADGIRQHILLTRHICFMLLFQS